LKKQLQFLNYKAKRNDVEIIFNADKNLIIKGDAIKFNQIVTNIVSNAIDAYQEDSLDKEINIKLTELENEIELKISDNGIGIEEKIINHIFEPFFTTKHNGENLGLGLSLIKKIVEKSFLGTIHVSSKVNFGTTFTIKIPV